MADTRRPYDSQSLSDSGKATINNAPWPNIPGFTILGELGRGNMGIIYKARQINLDRLVALQVIGGALATADELQRFLKESRVISSNLSSRAHVQERPTIIPVITDFRLAKERIHPEKLHGRTEYESAHCGR